MRGNRERGSVGISAELEHWWENIRKARVLGELEVQESWSTGRAYAKGNRERWNTWRIEIPGELKYPIGRISRGSNTGRLRIPQRSNTGISRILGELIYRWDRITIELEVLETSNTGRARIPLNSNTSKLEYLRVKTTRNKVVISCSVQNRVSKESSNTCAKTEVHQVPQEEKQEKQDQ